MGTVEPLKKAWRKRLATTLRRFHRARGVWPSRSIVAASKRGIDQAVKWPEASGGSLT